MSNFIDKICFQYMCINNNYLYTLIFSNMFLINSSDKIVKLLFGTGAHGTHCFYILKHFRNAPLYIYCCFFSKWLSSGYFLVIFYVPVQ